MEQSFNLKRAYLLFKSILIINKRAFPILSIMFIGAISILSIMDIIKSRDDIFEFDYIMKLGPMVIMWSIMSISQFADLFRYRNRLYINTSHIVPASTNEKFFVPFILAILAMIVILVSYIILLFLFWSVSGLINGNSVEFIDTLLNQGTMESNLVFIYMTVSLYSMTSLFCVPPNKYAWSGVCVWVLAIGISIFVFSKYDLWLIPYTVLTLALLSWIIIYVRFNKIEIKK